MHTLRAELGGASASSVARANDLMLTPKSIRLPANSAQHQFVANDPLLGPLREAELLEELPRSPYRLGPVEPVKLPVDLEVLLGAQALVQGWGLGEHASPGPQGRAIFQRR